MPSRLRRAIWVLPLVAACGGEPTLASAPPAFDTEVVSRYAAADRLVALGDIHGDLAAMREALSLADVIDEDDHWIGGETVVVQTGDVLDRGDDEQAIIDLLLGLQAEAAEAGGALHLMQGNHELMNVELDFGYVTEGGFADFEDAPGVDPDDPRLEALDPEMRARASAFMPGGSYAVKIAHHPVMLIVGDTAFAHGGVLPKYADDIEGTNREVADWLLGNDDHGQRIADADDSPVWSRHYSDEPSSYDCRLLGKALERLGAKRMVVGHTIHDTITSACNDRVFMVDVGMSAYYGGHPEVLELTAEGAFVLY